MANELDITKVHRAKIKAFLMQTSKILQAVILMLILAMAASCAMGKQYSSKVFGPRTGPANGQASTTVRFLGPDEESTGTDVLTLTKPVTTTDSVILVQSGNSPAKTPTDTLVPVQRSGNSGGVRTKRTRDNQ